MAHNVTKILCHPDKGGPFCVWHESMAAYACYFSDDDNPPDPQSLQIETRNGPRDLSRFVWEPTVSVVGNPDEDVQIYGEYDLAGDPV